jgi:hypothetical protein
MVSPGSNGTCWRGSGSVAAPPAGGITNAMQTVLFGNGGGGVAGISPLRGGATPAALKLRHGTPELVSGRFFCGHSGSSVTAGSVRGTHIG